MKKIGFTLMELLLVIAILAIVAAVAAPQFFRSGTQAMDDSRATVLKANYQAVKTALKMKLWDNANNKNITVGDANDFQFYNHGGVNDAAAKIRLLVNQGYLQENACYVEAGNGQRLQLGIMTQAKTAANPYDQVASVGIFMESTWTFSIWVQDKTGGTVVDIDTKLKSGETFEQIYYNYVRPCTNGL